MGLSMGLKQAMGYVGRGGLAYPTEIAAAASLVAAASEGELAEIDKPWAKHYASRAEQIQVREAIKILFDAIVAAEMRAEAALTWRMDGEVPPGTEG